MSENGQPYLGMDTIHYYLLTQFRAIRVPTSPRRTYNLGSIRVRTQGQHKR